jgi:hypothetical protein
MTGENSESIVVTDEVMYEIFGTIAGEHVETNNPD